jgi:phosphate-selective porin
MDVWSLGLNWWLTPYMNFNVNYRYANLDRFGVEGSSQGFDTRLMLILE